jgi:deoxyribodipyrimidine photo-lyase
MRELRVDPDVAPVADLPGGEPAAAERLEAFVVARLKGYGSGRSGGQADLTDERTSRLSAYLRYGQISPWRVAHQVAAAAGPETDRASFLEEVLIRRELGANFCWFNPRYRSLAGLPTWARETLRRHAGDRRAFTYSTAEFERAATHDPLWNAAQRQLLREGRIHNYLRMYWGKMILAWSATPQDALRTALRLNDRYGLDGRSANGYTNVLWCFGKHDRPWAERPVFGTVRFMAAAGVERKFRTEPYLAAFGP